jgi:hypothetical protein
MRTIPELAREMLDLMRGNQQLLRQLVSFLTK